jgi:hypothetical protein
MHPFLGRCFPKNELGVAFIGGTPPLVPLFRLNTNHLLERRITSWNCEDFFLQNHALRQYFICGSKDAFEYGESRAPRVDALGFQRAIFDCRKPVAAQRSSRLAVACPASESSTAAKRKPRFAVPALAILATAA